MSSTAYRMVVLKGTRFSLTAPLRRQNDMIPRALPALRCTTTSRPLAIPQQNRPLYGGTYQKPPSGTLAATSFHTSSKRSILPAEPQVVDGTANDPAPVPEPSPTHGSYHWAFERLVSAALIPLTIAPFAAGTLNPISDAILCATILIHSHIGFQSVIIDYVPKKRIPKTRVLFWWGLRLATLSVGVGLYEFETNDVGVTEAIKRIWTA